MLEFACPGRFSVSSPLMVTVVLDTHHVANLLLRLVINFIYVIHFSLVKTVSMISWDEIIFNFYTIKIILKYKLEYLGTGSIIYQVIPT